MQREGVEAIACEKEGTGDATVSPRCTNYESDGAQLAL